MDSAEYLGKATEWLNNYNNALSDLNSTVSNILASSGNATEELIYSSEMQNRINQALSSSLPNITTNASSLGSTLSYDRMSNTGNNQSVYINTVELPNVENADDFVNELKNLPRLATSQSTLRK